MIEHHIDRSSNFGVASSQTEYACKLGQNFSQALTGQQGAISRFHRRVRVELKTFSRLCIVKSDL